MLRLTIADGTYQVTLTLFDATEKLIECPPTNLLKKKKKLQWFLLLIEYEGKKILLSNLVNFMFQKDMNNIFLLIYCYGKSYMFLTKINKINDTSQL